jgi:adenylate cyclase class 2
MSQLKIEEEIEVKFFDVNLDSIRQDLTRIGATLKTPRRVMRRAVYGGEANPDMDCTYGRVRDEGDVVTMSAKYAAVNNEIASQKEAQIVIDSFESGVLILDSFGLHKTDYQENARETWTVGDGVLVELEEWPELPTYIEIEGKTEQDIHTVADQLGLEWVTHTTDSTDKLYMKHFNIDEAAVRLKLKDIRFTK